MSVFGNYTAAQVVEAAEKFINKMDERELGRAVAEMEHALSGSARADLIEAIFDAFRQRGESSEDVAEGAGTTLDAIRNNVPEAVSALLAYALTSPGLLKEATTSLIERRPAIVSELSPMLAEGIANRLVNR